MSNRTTGEGSHCLVVRSSKVEKPAISKRFFDFLLITYVIIN
jgi:hypothetical protein